MPIKIGIESAVPERISAPFRLQIYNVLVLNVLPFVVNIDGRNIFILIINELRVEKYRFDKDFASIFASHVIAKQYVLLFGDNIISDER